MTVKPFFSVVIPLYNKAPHVARSVGSVLDQTFTDFEIIVINDASTDESVSEVVKFDDSRIRLLHRDEPGPGGYAARNLGIKEAVAEWVAFLDADDEWIPEHLQKMFELSQSFPDCHLLSCGWKKVNPDGSIETDKYSQKNAWKGPHQISFPEYLKLFIHRYRPAWTSVVCLRKGKAAENLFPAGRVKRGGDLHAWVTYLAHTKTMARSTHTGATYYRNSVNMVTNTNSFNIKFPRFTVHNLSSILNKNELRLIKKYSNRRVWDEWMCYRFDNNSEGAIKLKDIFYWKDDLAFCTTRFFLSLLSVSHLKRFQLLKNSFRDVLRIR